MHPFFSMFLSLECNQDLQSNIVSVKVGGTAPTHQPIGSNAAICFAKSSNLEINFDKPMIISGIMMEGDPTKNDWMNNFYIVSKKTTSDAEKSSGVSSLNLIKMEMAPSPDKKTKSHEYNVHQKYPN